LHRYLLLTTNRKTRERTDTETNLKTDKHDRVQLWYTTRNNGARGSARNYGIYQRTSGKWDQDALYGKKNDIHDYS